MQTAKAEISPRRHLSPRERATVAAALHILAQHAPPEEACERFRAELGIDALCSDNEIFALAQEFGDAPEVSVCKPIR